MNDGDVVWSDADGNLLPPDPAEILVPYDVLAQCDTDAKEVDRLRPELVEVYARLEKSEARNRQLERRPGFFAGLGAGVVLSAVLVMLAVLAD